MEQSNQLPVSVKIRQNIAAVLLVLTDVYWILNTLGTLTGRLIGGTASTYVTILSCVFIINLIAWVLLLTVSANKPTRIACITILLLALGSAFLPALIMTNTALTITWNSLYLLLKVYAFAIILKANTNLASEDQTWIKLLLVVSIPNFIVSLANVLFPELPFTVCITWFIWCIIYYILVGIAEFRVAKCAAFTGRTDAEDMVENVYSPLNKYFAAVFITVPIILGLLYIISSNVNSIENLF